MEPPQIALKRVYDSASEDDGVRILVERLWPRGLTKAAASIDHWTKDVAPSAELRRWFDHQVERWDDFQVRYRAELEDNQQAVDALRSLCQGHKVTFVFAAKDIQHNGAVVLREFLMTPQP